MYTYLDIFTYSNVSKLDDGLVFFWCGKIFIKQQQHQEMPPGPPSLASCHGQVIVVYPCSFAASVRTVVLVIVTRLAAKIFHEGKISASKTEPLNYVIQSTRNHYMCDHFAIPSTQVGIDCKFCIYI